MSDDDEPEEPDLFAPRKSAADQAKREGMERVDRHADEDWKELMFALVERVARMMPRFTSDDVFDLYAATGATVTTHDRRAFGPVMLRAAKAGFCRKAQCAPVNSRRASLHASPRSVWDSLIYEGPGWPSSGPIISSAARSSTSSSAG